MATNNEKSENNLGSLGKQTKKQLIDIILRKDDIEKKLSKEIKYLKEEYNDVLKKVNNLQMSIANHTMSIASKDKEIEYLRAAIDDTERQELKNVFMIVDFPLPVEPIIAIISPFFASKEILLITGSFASAYPNVTFSNLMVPTSDGFTPFPS